SDEKFLAVNRSSGPCRVWDLQSSEVVAKFCSVYFQGEIFGFCRFSNKADNSHVLFITVMEGDIKLSWNLVMVAHDDVTVQGSNSLLTTTTTT
ncbi:hypothetical protein ACJX0J_020001, partial [Zea mays]